MNRKDVHLKINELKSDVGLIKNLELSIGKILEEAIPDETVEETSAVPVATASTLPITAGGFKIILKDAKIYAKKVIIRSMKSEKPEKGEKIV